MSTIQFHTYSWDVERPKAIIHVIHGMSEHAARYEHFAMALNKAGYSVVASDLRGHGKTADGIENIGFFAVNDGWNIVTQDVIHLTEEIRFKNREVPIFMLGHSMGSFIARTVAFTVPDLVDGYIISGTMGHPGWKGAIGKPISKLMGALFGKRTRSKFLMNTSFQGWDKNIKNKRTDRDWLTRDEDIVDAYLNDPFCSQVFTNQFFYDLADGVNRVNATANIQRINRTLPVCFISGVMDPAGSYGKGPNEVAKRYKDAGVVDVELKLFEGARHELLNEINREEVYAYVINWLDRHIL